MTTPKPLSREDIAKREIGETTIARPMAIIIVAAFILTVLIIPGIQFAKDRAAKRAGALAILDAPGDAWDAFSATKGSPLIDRIFAANANMLASMQGYESDLEDDSFLVQGSVPPMQALNAAYLGLGNEQAYVGRDGWLFYRPGIDYLTGPGFLDPKRLRSRSLSGSEHQAPPQPDPRVAIADMQQQLAARGITLIVMPVPVKGVIRPDRLSSAYDQGSKPVLNPSYQSFIDELRRDGILIYDPSELLARLNTSSDSEIFLKTDTHWRPEAMEAVAEDLAAYLMAHSDIALGNIPYRREPIEIENHGDITVMLKLPAEQNVFPVETVTTSMVLSPKGELWRSHPSAEVLLLGDSFSNIYSLAAMNWGESAGLAEHLSCALKQPIDALLRNDAGAYASRAMLAHDLARGTDRLAGKKVVVWEFAARELAVGDWKLLDLTLGEPRESSFFEPEPGTRLPGLQARVQAVSAIPRPGTVPYKDHIYALHLSDLTGPGINESCDAVVYMRSMKDGVLTAAASYRPGDSIHLDLQSWNDVATEYERFNRSELEDQDLQFEPPCWGVPAP